MTTPTHRRTGPLRRVEGVGAVIALVVGAVVVAGVLLIAFWLGVGGLEALWDRVYAVHVPSPRLDYVLVVASCAVLLWIAVSLLWLSRARTLHLLGGLFVLLTAVIAFPLLPDRYSDQEAQHVAAAMDRGLTTDQVHALEYAALTVAIGAFVGAFLLPAIGRYSLRRTASPVGRPAAYAYVPRRPRLMIAAVPVLAIVAGGVGFLSVRDLHSVAGQLDVVANGFRTNPQFVLSSGETVTAVDEAGCSAVDQTAALGAGPYAHCVRTLRVTIAAAGGSWTYGFEEFVLSGEATSAHDLLATRLPAGRLAVVVQHVVLTAPTAAPPSLTKEVGDALVYVQLGTTN